MKAYLRVDRIAKRAIIEVDGVFYHINVPHGQRATWLSRKSGTDMSRYTEYRIGFPEEQVALDIVHAIRQLSGEKPVADKKVESVTKAIHMAFEPYWGELLYLQQLEDAGHVSKCRQ